MKYSNNSKAIIPPEQVAWAIERWLADIPLTHICFEFGHVSSSYLTRSIYFFIEKYQNPEWNDVPPGEARKKRAKEALDFWKTIGEVTPPPKSRAKARPRSEFYSCIDGMKALAEKVPPEDREIIERTCELLTRIAVKRKIVQCQH